MVSRTCAGRCPSPGSVMWVLLTEPVHFGYAAKSAITCMMAAGSAAMISDCEEGVAMGGRLPRSRGVGCAPTAVDAVAAARRRPTCADPAIRLLQVHVERPRKALEMADIHAFRAAAAGAPAQRLVDVTEHRQRRGVRVDRLAKAGAVHLHSGRHHVVAQLRDTGRDVRAQDVD